MFRRIYLISLLFNVFLVMGKTYSQVSFTDVAKTAGVGYDEGAIYAAWGDYNNDGYIDLYVANGTSSQPNILYRNNGNGTFTDVTSSAGVPGSIGSHYAAWGDYDNDSDLDLYLGNYHDNILYRNNGDGTFTDVTSSAGVPGQPSPAYLTRGVAWGDYDNDGYLDLYVANGTDATAENSPNVLYHNNGEGTFTDVTVSSGMSNSYQARCYVWGDYDNDGWLDIFISNRQEQPSALYKNNGDGTFSDVTSSALLNDFSTGSDVIWVDFDGDGNLDLFTVRQNCLFRNNGDETFAEVPELYNIQKWDNDCNGVVGDYDNDGRLDFFIKNLAATDAMGQRTWSKLYHNNIDGTFTNVASSVGLTNKNGWGYRGTWSDYDNDGDLDLYVCDGESVIFGSVENTLYRNDGGTNNYLEIRTVGSSSNRDGIGARIKVVAGSDKQYWEISGGSGNSLMAEFGLGTHTQVDSVIVKWPSGVIQVLTDVPVNQRLTILETSNRPCIASVSPNQNALNILRQSTVSASFNREIDSSTLNASTLIVIGALGGKYDGTINYGSGTQTVSFDPEVDFEYGENVTVILTNGIQATNGQYMENSFVWSFIVEVNGGSGTFNPATNYDVGQTPTSIFSGNIDNDSDIDVVTANGASNSISLLINNGDGTFASSVNTSVSTNPSYVWVADFDNDGNVDLVTANETSDNIAILINQGSGTFAAPQYFGAGTDPNCICGSDFDGDGDIDLAVLNSGSNDVSVLSNDGNAVFYSLNTINVGSFPVGICCGDLDKDGDMDLAIAHKNQNNLSIWLNNGDGIFSEISGSPFSLGNEPSSIYCSDLGRDSYLGIVVSNFSVDSVSVLFNKGNGAFVTSKIYGVEDGPSSAICSDLTGDGYPDLITTNQNSNSISIMLNKRDGTFNEDVVFGAGNGTSSLACGDFDADGDLDLATSNSGSHNVSIFLNQPRAVEVTLGSQNPSEGSVSPEQNDVEMLQLTLINYTIEEVCVSSITFYASGTGDDQSDLGGVNLYLDGNDDGLLDAQDVQIGSSQNYSTDDGNVTFSSLAKTIYPSSSENWLLVYNFSGNGEGGKTFKAHFQNNTDLTVVGAVSQEAVDVHGAPISSEIQTIAYFSSISSAFPTNSGSAAAWGDYDNDGDQDLFVARGNSWWSQLYRLNEDNTFSEVSGSLNIDVFASNFAWGDYNNDGFLDIYSAQYMAPNHLYKNVSGAHFEDVTSASGPILDDEGKGVGVCWGDYDRDGDIDLLLLNNPVGNSHLFRNNGDFTFTDVSSEAGISFYGNAVTWVDYDNDGDLDIYMTKRYGGRLYRNNSDGTFTDVTSEAGGGINDPDGNGKDIAWGDYNNDEFLDLYRSNYSSPNHLFKNNGDGTFTDVTSIVGGGLGDTRASGVCSWVDYDNDGYIDLYLSAGYATSSLFRNKGDGTFIDVINQVGGGLNDAGLPSWADYDDDGDIDLYLLKSAGYLFRNNCNGSNNWLIVKLIGKRNNSFGLGSRVRIVADGQSQIREVGLNSGKSQDSFPVEFGLGSANLVDSLIVRWPTGTQQILKDIAANQTIAVQECDYSDVELGILGSEIFFNEGDNDPGDGHAIDMTFTSLTGNGNVTVQQTNQTPSNAPCSNVCAFRWDISKDEGITAFSADITFHYTDADISGYPESPAYLGIAKLNRSTNTLQWLGGIIDASANTVIVSGFTSFSTFALF